MSLPPLTMLRFWTMLAHYHGQVWNAAEPARSLGISMPTVRRYLDFFTGLFLIRQLQPWHENVKKRQVKAPKVYLRDSGILHALLGLTTEKEILSHPKVGASWEGYALEEVLRTAKPDEAFFWAAHSGAELDLLMFRRGRRFGVEFKYQDAPRMTPSLRTALEVLHLDHLAVVYPGDRSYDLADRVSVVPLAEAATSVESVLPAARKKR